jgi:hypothetical protein
MLKLIAVCVLCLAAADAFGSAAAPSPSPPKTGIAMSLAVLPPDEARVNVRIYGSSKVALDPSRFAFQLRSEMTGVVYFVGSTPIEPPLNVTAADAAWRAIVFRVVLRIPKVDVGVYDLSVDPGVRSSILDDSRLALSEPLYIHATSVTPVRVGTKYFLTPDAHHTDLPIDYVFSTLSAHSGLPTGAPEIDDPIAETLSVRFSNKPLWTFGRLTFTCFGGANMGMQVNSDGRQPMHIDRIIRVANIFTTRPFGDPFECMSSCGENWHSSTYHPLVALFNAFGSEPTWMRYPTTPAPSPHPGTCTQGTYAFVDDSDIERTFTTEDPHVVHPEWDPQMRASMLDYKVQVGMTHEMVAFAMGYPATTGTRAELEKLSEWTWRPQTSCAAAATFDGDVLVKFGGSIECGSTIDVY